MASGTITINGLNGWQYGTSSWLSSYGSYDLNIGRYNNTNYQPFIMKFTTPSFSGVSTSLQFKFAMKYRNVLNQSARWAICTSDANRDKYRDTHSAVTDSYQVASGTVTFTVNGSGTTYNVPLNITTTALKGSTTYYLFIWSGSDTGYTSVLHSTGAKTTGTIEYTTAYNLTISQGTGSTITVNRTSSSYGSTGNLSNGATLYPSDELTITITANTGYKIVTQSHTSGSTVTVSGDLNVSATAEVATTASACSLLQKNYYNGGWKGWNTASGYAGGSYPYVLQFKTPTFSGISTKISFSLSMTTVSATSATSSTLRYALASSEGNKDKYIGATASVTDSYQIKTGTWSVSSLSTTASSKTLNISTTELQSNTTYYLYLWGSYAVTILNLSSCSATLTHIQAYKLTVSAGTGSTVTVNRTSSSYVSTGNLANGATICPNDVLKITFGVNPGYELLTHTVNGSTFTSGDSHTVSEAVAIASTAKLVGTQPQGVIYIDNGTSFEAYQVYIDNGYSWNLYEPYIDNGSSWVLYS